MVKLIEVTMIHAPDRALFDLARSVEVHLAGNVHSGRHCPQFTVIMPRLPQDSSDWRNASLAREAFRRLALAHQRNHRHGPAVLTFRTL